MKRLYGDVVFIAGASSGMGKAIAEAMSQEGYRVYGTSRKPCQGDNDVLPQPNQKGGFIKMLQLDVCSDESVEAAVRYVMDKEHAINILINCAGFALAGSVEDTTPEEAYQEFNTNFFGAHRMCRRVAPIMRANGNGLIVNIGSVAGIITIPYQSFYSASKYALEAMTEALRMELSPFGVRVSLIDPGDTKTEFTNSRVFVNAAKDSAYKSTFEKSVARMIKDEQGGPPPVGVVAAVKRVVSSPNPPVRVVVGTINKVYALLKRLLPSRAVLYIVSKLYA